MNGVASDDGTSAARALCAVAVLGCLVALLLGVAPSAAVGVSRLPPSVVDRFLRTALERTGLPGMGFALTHGGDVVEVRGFGADGHGGPVNGRTQFRVGSLSKSFTAVAVLRLVEAERVDLDRPVRAYLPGFTTADPGSSDRITVRELLNQTSGLADPGYPGITSDEPHDLADRVRQLRDAHLVSPPGREFHYFDPNYQLLARLVEVVRGQPFQQALRELVLDPLGMNDTVAPPSAQEAISQAPRLAGGHILLFDHPLRWGEQDGLLAGSGGIITTAADMARWLSWQNTDRPALLTPADLALSHTPPLGVSGGYAMGWQQLSPPDGPVRLEHTGVLSTFSAAQTLLPATGYGFVLIYNANSALAKTEDVTAGLAALLTGAPTVGVRGTVVLAWVFGGCTLLALVVRAVQLRRLSRWRARRVGRSWWAALPGVLIPLASLALLAELPALIGALIGRSFTYVQLSLAMPDVVILLAVAGLTGAVLAGLRLHARSRPCWSEGHSDDNPGRSRNNAT